MTFATISIIPYLTIKDIALVLKVVFKQNKIIYKIRLLIKFDDDLNDHPLLIIKFSRVAITTAEILDKFKLIAKTLLNKVYNNSSTAAVEPPTNIYLINCL